MCGFDHSASMYWLYASCKGKTVWWGPYVRIGAGGAHHLCQKRSEMFVQEKGQMCLKEGLTWSRGLHGTTVNTEWALADKQDWCKNSFVYEQVSFICVCVWVCMHSHTCSCRVFKVCQWGKWFLWMVLPDTSHGQCRSKCECVKQSITLVSQSPVPKAKVSALVGVGACCFFRDPLDFWWAWWTWGICCLRISLHSGISRMKMPLVCAPGLFAVHLTASNLLFSFPFCLGMLAFFSWTSGAKTCRWHHPWGEKG